MRPLFAFALFFAYLCGCTAGSKPSTSNGYTIGIDPTWYPLHVKGTESNILAFSIELLTKIGKQENLPISVVEMNWDSLMWGLKEHKYQGILSTLRPYTFYLKEYAFSHPYLLTGPVVVLPKEVKSDSLIGKEIGVVRGSAAALALQTTPNILLQGYDSIPDVFSALEANQIDGAAIEVLAAARYIRDLFPEKFRIASTPLNDMGLRLISQSGDVPDLMKRFDRGLKTMKKSGEYQKLLSKWGLSES